MTRDDRAGEAAEEAIATVRELLLGEDDGHASATFDEVYSTGRPLRFQRPPMISAPLPPVSCAS